MEYKLSEIAQIVGGELRGEDCTVCDVVTDSRGSIGNNSLFVAMRGKNHDSHCFTTQMCRRGIKAFMVEYVTPELEGRSYIIVERSIPALQLLAKYHRSNFMGQVVGITGSNGKTTIKEWIAQLAPESLKLFRSPRSYNSQLGVALSLLMIEGDEDLAIIEAGISRPNEMATLEEMIDPDIAIISSIGEAHQEGFNSMEQKIEEKMILTRRASTVIYSSEYPELTPYILFNDRRCSYINAAEFPKAMFQDQASQNNSQIVAALFHALSLNAPLFEDVTPLAMRLEMIEGLSDSIVINDSYNSDINSLQIALDTLKNIASSRPTTIILSDILQSGTTPEQLYKRVAAALSRAGVDRLVGIGGAISSTRSLFECECRFFASTEEFLKQMTTEEYAGRAILLKGSRKSHFERISHALAHKSHTTTLEVNLSTMVENLNLFRSHLAPETKLVAMVKASSYGAGEGEVAQTLQHQGVDYLAVAFADEGSRLREQGISMPIIVLNADDGSFSQMVDSRLEPEIYSLRSLQDFAAAVEARGEREYPIHIKIDSGMHRLGFMEEDIEALVQQLVELEGVVRVASIFSHLATADMGEEGRAKTLSQIELFRTMSDELHERIGYKTPRHIANSAAIVAYPESHFEMCRLGIGLYGFGGDEFGLGLQPISTLKSRIVQIREITRDQRIGYGCDGEISTPKGRIATIPIGYADGIDRHLGNGAWSFMVGGKRAPIVGRVCMDSCMVDISHLEKIKEGDEVIIFSPKAGHTAADMAAQLGTISYEVLTSISSRVKRIYIKE